MKYVLVIGDGMADTGLPQLAGKTPLEALALPAFDRVAGCQGGRVLTVPHGLPPGSDTAILSIFGYDPRRYYTGRSVLEAAGMGISLPEGSLSFRVNLCAVTSDEKGALVIHSHNGGGIHGQQAVDLMEALVGDPAFSALMEKSGLTLHITDTFRHIGVLQTQAHTLSALCLTEPHNVLEQPIEAFLPHTTEVADAPTQALAQQVKDMMLLSYQILKEHPVNQKRRQAGLLPATMIWPWGAASAVALPSFQEKYGHSGSVISAVPLVWGIAALAGLQTPRVSGANGELDTNYEGKADAAIEALLAGDSFAAVHVEAPDEMSHAGNLAAKLEAIQQVESRVVARLLSKLPTLGEDFRLLLLSDHPTLLTTRTHDGSPVPYGIYDSRTVAAASQAGSPTPTRKFCEKEMSCEPVLMEGTDLMPLLFQQGPYA